MLDRNNIERSLAEGPGKITVASAREQIFPHILARIGSKWILAIAAVNGTYSVVIDDCLIAAFERIIKKVTTNKFRSFLNLFGLTIEDVFNDNPTETTKFIAALCGRIRQDNRYRENLHPSTLPNLREWLAALSSEPAKSVHSELACTIAALQALPLRPQAKSPIEELGEAANEKL